MRQPENHRCRLIGSPWDAVHCTVTESARHYGRHWHANYGLGLVEYGAHRSASGRGTVDAYAGDLITTNPGEVHDGRPLGSPSRRWRIVYLDPAAFTAMQSCPASSDNRSDVEITRPVMKDEILRRALRDLFARLEAWNLGLSRSAADIMACDEALARTCGLLLARHTSSLSHEEMGGDVRRVRDRLADELLDPPTLADLAAMVGLSKFQLLRRFERTYGVPPHAWLVLQRGEHARRLIRDGLSLSQAAVSSGFADQSHMTRNFVRQFGFTPGAWRRGVAFNRPQ
jgi:AraC-like DNA-binding protein